MISLCVVTHDLLQDYLDIFLESVEAKCKNVSEIIVCNTSGDFKGGVENGKIITIEPPSVIHKLPHDFTGLSQRHSIALRHAISQAKNDYVIMADCDVFIYKDNIDEWFLDLMHQNNANMVGCSRHNPTYHAHTHFPCIQFSLVKKKELPPPTWLKGQIKIGYLSQFNFDGEYLSPYIDTTPEMMAKYPQPEANKDTGFLLYLWAVENNWRWITFLPEGLHVYKTKYMRSNFDLKNKFKVEKLVYHQSGVFHHHSRGLNPIDTFREEYEGSKLF